MPENAPKIKQENVRGFGAHDPLLRADVAAREARPAPRSRRETAPTLVHPYDDARVIAGQGTAALELLEDVPGPRRRDRPGGRRRAALRHGDRGQGAAAGRSASSAPSRRTPTTPRAASRSGTRRAAEPRPATIADGLRTPLSAAHARGDPRARRRRSARRARPASSRAMRMTWERMKIIIEPSSRGAARRDRSRSTLDVAGARVGVDRSPAATSTSTGCRGSSSGRR